jgi:hypothetical protein
MVTESESPKPSADVPTLLTRTNPGDKTGGALIRGVLAVNSANCFALNEKILVAPASSRVLGQSEIDLAGMGRFKVGDPIEGGGGGGGGSTTEFRPTPEQRRCVPDGADPGFVAISPLK